MSIMASDDATKVTILQWRILHNNKLRENWEMPSQVANPPLFTLGIFPIFCEAFLIVTMMKTKRPHSSD